MKKMLALLTLLPLAALADQVRILPLGDSITEGVGWEDGGGYRAVLREKLLNAGYDVKFVGNNTTYPGGVEGFLHEGHGGWYLYTIREALPGWMSTMEDPHVILLMIGTNDFGGHFDYKNILYRLGGLLDELSEKQPSAKIIVSTLTPRTEDWDENYLKPYYNNGLPALVAEHQAKGQHVSMIDLYSALNRGTPAVGGDFPDELHPNEGGYRKMAQAWFDGIQAVLPVAATATMSPNRLAVVQTLLESDRKGVRIYFNRRVSDSAAVLSNYAFSGQFQPTSASISEDRRSVLLRSGAVFSRGEFTRVKIRNVTCETDGAPIDERIVEVCQPYGAEHYVPEAANYRRIYALDIPVRSQYKDQPVQYDVDEHSSVTDFSRVAYYLELEKEDGTVKYAWVSMDAFTNATSKLGVPTRASEAVFQQYVTNLKVWSNQETVKPGAKARGNIEFWPYNYAQTPSLGVGVAKQDCYDVDDTCSYEWDYACMQIHDTDALTPIICYNCWGNGDNDACLGIGAGPVYDWSSRDWTMANNAGSYLRRRLEVYVLEDGASASAPALVSTRLTPSGTRLELVFDKAIATADCTPDRFALSDGTRVASVERSADGTRLVLAFAARPAGGATLAVSSVHSSAGATRPFTDSVSVPAPMAAVPAEVGAFVGEKANGYRLVYAADIPERQEWSLNGKVDYFVDDRVDIPFDRVAFFMELASPDGTTTNWVWVSTDKYTDGLSARELSIPVCWDGKAGRYRLSNLEVASNVSGVLNGTSATGVAEIWNGEYYQGHVDDSFGGSDYAYDWNDWWNSDAPNHPEYNGHGCFQFFATSDDMTTGQTLFAFNHWRVGGDYRMDVGIGNRDFTDENNIRYTDWTWAQNTGDYGTRRIYAFVRPVSTDVPAEVVDKVGDSADGYKLLYRIDLESSMTVNNGNYGDMYVNREVYNRIHGVNNANVLSHYAYSRVAYCLELVKKDTQETSWIWTAFDWQGDKFAAIDIPTAEGGISAMVVTNLEIKSNVASITTGANIATGNIEFSPYNYWTPNNNYYNTYIVPNADQGKCDFGDHLYGTGSDDGHEDGVGHYGCMQVHNYGARQTLWAVNHFNGGSDAGPGMGVGIGNNSGYHPDWTNEQTGDQYEKMTLYVMIQTCPRVEPQQAVVANNRRQVCVTCANEVAVVDPAWFSVDGVTPASARVSSADLHDIILDFSAALAETSAHTVRVAVPGAAVRELACASPRALPACLASVDEASGYVLVNDLAIRGTAPNYDAQGVDYIVDECHFGDIPYDRVGYLLELKTKNQDDYRWVWVSMDKFTDDIKKIAVPTVKNDGLIQKIVSNLHVEAGAVSGSAPVKTGDWADGNIEFTPFNYNQTATFNFDGASSEYFDFDDSFGRDSVAGYACMQVHNYRERETVFAFNHYNWGDTPYVMIGNAPNHQHSDGTFLANADGFEIVNLRVFVRPASITPSRGDGPAFYLQPRNVTYPLNPSETVTLASLAPEANYYQWFKDGVALPGETDCNITVPATEESAGVYHVVAYFDDDNYTVSRSAVLKQKMGFSIILQ